MRNIERFVAIVGDSNCGKTSLITAYRGYLLQNGAFELYNQPSAYTKNNDFIAVLTLHHQKIALVSAGDDMDRAIEGVGAIDEAFRLCAKDIGVIIFAINHNAPKVRSLWEHEAFRCGLKIDDRFPHLTKLTNATQIQSHTQMLCQNLVNFVGIK